MRLKVCVAQPALGHVEDALELEIVGGVEGDLQIGDGVLDLLAFVEARAADHAIGQPERDEPVLEGAHLERCPHQDGDLVEALAALAQSLDVVADGARLLLVVPEGGDADALAHGVVGEERLAEAALVVGDEAGCRRQDVPGGAIVALEPDDDGVGEVALEAQDVVDLGAAPAVNRLVVVAHAADVGRAAGQQAQPQVLGDVGVLVLVDQDVAEPLPVVRQHVRVVAEQAQHLEQEVAEVGRVQLLEALLVGGVELGALALGEAEGLAARYLVGREAAVLPAVDQGGQLARWPAVLVEALALDHLPDEAQLIVGIEDREAGLQAHQLGMAAQNPDTDGVERAEPRHALDRAAHQRADPLLHLARGLVGESYREDSRGPGPSGAQDMGNACGQDAGLAGPGACEHQDVPVERFDGRALLRVELGEIGGLRASERPRRYRHRPARRRTGGHLPSGRLSIRGHPLQL